MGKFKQTLLTNKAYSQLKEAKEIFERNTGRRSSFTEVITQMVGKQLVMLKMDQDIKSYIMAFVDKIVENPHTLGIILFGSVAKGNFTKFSDIDIAVITDSKYLNYLEYLNKSRRELEQYQENLIKRGLSLYISPLIINIEDVKKINPIYFEIVDYGIVLFQRGNAVSEFLKYITNIHHKRVNTEFGEIIVWE
jgi:predicted nucleotidyltransferase